MRSRWYVASSTAFLCILLSFFVAGVYIPGKQPTMPAASGKKASSASRQRIYSSSARAVLSPGFFAAHVAPSVPTTTTAAITLVHTPGVKASATASSSVGPAAPTTSTGSANIPVIKASVTAGSATKDTKNGSVSDPSLFNNPISNSPLFNTLVTCFFTLVGIAVTAFVSFVIQSKQEKDNDKLLKRLSDTSEQTTTALSTYYQNTKKMQEDIEKVSRDVNNLRPISSEVNNLRREVETLRQGMIHLHHSPNATSHQTNGQTSIPSQNANARTQNVSAAPSEPGISPGVSILDKRLKDLLEKDFTTPISAYPGINISMPQSYYVTYLTPSNEAKLFQESITGYKRDPNEIILDDWRVQEAARRKGFALKYDDSELNLHKDPWTSLEQSERYHLIEGDCAVTQTMLLKYLALKTLKGRVYSAFNADQTPVRLELPIYINKIMSEEILTNAPENDLLTSFVAQKAQALKEQLLSSSDPLDVTVERIEAFLREYIVSRRALLLIDWVNTPNYNAAIAKIIKKYPSLPILITTTLTLSNVTLTEFKRWKILPLTLEDVRTLSVTAQPAMLRRLEQYPRIASLITSLPLFEYVKRKYSNASSTNHPQIYEYTLCKDALLSNAASNPPSWLEDLSRHLGKQPQETVEFLLGCIAWHLHKTYGRIIEKNNIYSYIIEDLRELPIIDDEKSEIKNIVEQGIDSYMLDFGLLKEVRMDSFSMASFAWQEYFVASYVLTHSQEEQTIFQHYNDPWWEEIVLLYLDLVNAEKRKTTQEAKYVK